MKHLILIIHDDLKQEVADLFRGMTQVKGFTFSATEGHGVHSEDDPFLSARDKVVGYTPRVRVDILLEDKHLAPILTALRKSEIGLNHHSIYWVTTVNQHGRL